MGRYRRRALHASSSLPGESRAIAANPAETNALTQIDVAQQAAASAAISCETPSVSPSPSNIPAPLTPHPENPPLHTTVDLPNLYKMLLQHSHVINAMEKSHRETFLQHSHVINAMEKSHRETLLQHSQVINALEKSSRETVNQHSHVINAMEKSHRETLLQHSQVINALEKSSRETVNQHREVINAQAATIASLKLNIQQLEAKVAIIQQEVAEVQVQKESDSKIEHNQSWADVLKQSGTLEAPSSFVSAATLSETRLRERKALNVRVRGIPDSKNALDEAKRFLETHLQYHSQGLNTAWRTKKDVDTLVLRFSSINDRRDTLRQRAKLKGTGIFLDEDLTFIQVVERKKALQEAKDIGRRLICRDDTIRFIKIRPSPTKKNGTIEGSARVSEIEKGIGEPFVNDEISHHHSPLPWVFSDVLRCFVIVLVITLALDLSLNLDLVFN